MIQNIFSVLCESSIIDKDTNNITINNVLEQIKIAVSLDSTQLSQKDIPINTPIKYEIISLWKEDKPNPNTNYNIELVIVDPDNKVIQSIPQKFKFENGIVRHRSIFKINGFVATINGTYTFLIKIKAETENKFQEASRIPLDIEIIKSKIVQNKILN